MPDSKVAPMRKMLEPMLEPKKKADATFVDLVTPRFGPDTTSHVETLKRYITEGWTLAAAMPCGYAFVTDDANPSALSEPVTRFYFTKEGYK